MLACTHVRSLTHRGVFWCILEVHLKRQCTLIAVWHTPAPFSQCEFISDLKYIHLYSYVYYLKYIHLSYIQYIQYIHAYILYTRMTHLLPCFQIEDHRSGYLMKQGAFQVGPWGHLRRGGCLGGGRGSVHEGEGLGPLITGRVLYCTVTVCTCVASLFLSPEMEPETCHLGGWQASDSKRSTGQ